MGVDVLDWSPVQREIIISLKFPRVTEKLVFFTPEGKNQFT